MLNFNNNVPFNVLNVGHAENNKFASKVYDATYDPHHENNDGDVRFMNMTEAAEKYSGIEFFCFGFPCQDLSINSNGRTGKGSGDGIKFHCGNCRHEYDPLSVPPEDRDRCPNCNSSDKISKTRSSLLTYALEFVRRVKPKVVLIENVANFVKSSKNRPTFELLKSELESYGYLFRYDLFDARDFGIPQSRNRVMIVAIHETVPNRENFKFPARLAECPDLSLFLEDKSECCANSTETVIMHKSVPPYVRKNIEDNLENILASDKDIFRMKCKSGYADNVIGLKVAPTLRAQNKTAIIMQSIETETGTKKLFRSITPLEAFRLMGFTDEQYRVAAENVSITQRFKLAGNSIVVPVLEAIVEELYNAFPELFINGRLYHMFNGIGSFDAAFQNVVKKANAHA